MDFEFLTLEEQVEYAEAEVQRSLDLLQRARKALKDSKTLSYEEELNKLFKTRQKISEAEALFGVDKSTREEESLEVKRQRAIDEIFFGPGSSESPNPELNDYSDKHGL